MKGGEAATALRSPGLASPRRARARLALSAALRSLDGLTVALILLITSAWLSEGVAALLGVSSGLVGKVVDAEEAALAVWLGLRLVRERRTRLVAPLVLYGVWVATGLINSHAPTGSNMTALRNWLLAPVLAGLLAIEGSGEGRARAVFAALCALTGFEFLLSIVQLFVVPLAARNPDLIVGSFGASQNAVFGLAILLVAGVGTAGYLVNARRGKPALLGVLVLSLASSWVIVKFATVLLPVVVLMTAVTALVLRRADRRRALAAVVAAVVSSGVVIGSYAAFNPNDFSALNPAGGLGTYLANGSTAGNMAGQQLGHTVIRDFWNAGVSVSSLPVSAGRPGQRGVQISNLSAGNYTAAVSKPGFVGFPVQPGRAYRFEFKALNGSQVSQDVIPQIEWGSSPGMPPSITVGPSVAQPEGTDRPVLVTVAGFAPPDALMALPKIAVVGSNPPEGSSIYVWSPTLTLTTGRAAAGFAQVTEGGTTLGDYWNAGIQSQSLLTGRPGASSVAAFRISNRDAGDFTAELLNGPDEPFRAVPGGVYRFTVTVRSPYQVPAVAMPQLEWRTEGPTAQAPFRAITTIARGAQVPLAAPARGAVRLRLTATAPVRTSYVYPKVAILGASAPRSRSRSHRQVLPAGSVVIAESPTFRQVGRTRPPGIAAPPGPKPAGGASGPPSTNGGKGAGAPRTPTSRPQPKPHETPSGSGSPSGPIKLAPLPGHLTLLKTAVRGLSVSVSRELFGFGLGAARLPPVVETAHLTPQEAAAESDAGTLLIERGWSGMVIVALIAILLVILAARLTRGSPAGRWSTAFRIALPGVMVAMVAYALIGAMLQNHSAAITFWVIVGLGLSLRTGPAEDSMSDGMKEIPARPGAA
jgi:hypothetical protein